jgi:CrcB protein
MSGVSLSTTLLVAAGGAAGSVLRYLLSAAAVEAFGTGFPWGTLAVNLLGSAAIGVAGGMGLAGEWRLLLVTGLLGGFTTFSAFSLETGLLWQRAWWLAAVYVAASLVLGLAAFALCYAVARR